MRTPLVRPPALRPCETVAIVSTSSPVPADELARLRRPVLLGAATVMDRIFAELPAGKA
ncbi:hypothetical protein JQS43_14345 [Natronosporangium hydrolyticum]|uniref:Uncharacterized protein n=1 Tax=Natronosporangium hydrolyticum TaxID=2811111 RepID=A0A895YF89_9ACTN|nr:hypothetical protein [Natronosporangium hydrolyticum]QSB12860.1 hypothetical protein JQS43_14345 [Natronosporangium hydrolyticum]